MLSKSKNIRLPLKAVRGKMKRQEITGKDVNEAIRWARSKKRKIIKKGKGKIL